MSELTLPVDKGMYTTANHIRIDAWKTIKEEQKKKWKNEKRFHRFSFFFFSYYALINSISGYHLPTIFFGIFAHSRVMRSCFFFFFRSLHASLIMLFCKFRLDRALFITNLVWCVSWSWVAGRTPARVAPVSRGLKVPTGVAQGLENADDRKIEKYSKHAVQYLLLA